MRTTDFFPKKSPISDISPPEFLRGRDVDVTVADCCPTVTSSDRLRAAMSVIEAFGIAIMKYRYVSDASCR